MPRDGQERLGALRPRLAVHVVVVVGHRVERHERLAGPLGPLAQEVVEHLLPGRVVHLRGLRQHAVQIEQASAYAHPADPAWHPAYVAARAWLGGGLPGTAISMRAIRVDQPGGPVRMEDVPVPEPGVGEALVEVHAAALTAGERAWPRHWPATLSHEMSGTVIALGEGASGPPVGEHVLGLVSFDLDGAAADYVVAPAADLAVKPAAIDFLSAASMTLAPLTAWQALVDHGHIQPGQHVLVNGAAGGVGSYAVQLAVALGASVTATASARDADFVAELGADRVLDYARLPAGLPERDVDIAIDLAGTSAMTAIWPSLRPGGAMIGIATEPSAMEADRHQARADFFIVAPNGSELAALARFANGGLLRTMASEVFPLEAADQALDTVDNGRVRGKVVLAVQPAEARDVS